MPKKALGKYLRKLLSRAMFQPFLDDLQRLCLAGMNIGGGTGVQRSGEILVIKYLEQHIAHGETPVVFDVGANVGDYSSAVLSILGKNVRLCCFEPSRVAFAKLERKLGQHGAVELYNFGFWDKQELAALHSDVEGSGLSSLFARRLDHFGIEMSSTEQVELRRLDDYCQEKGITHIHLLKLDVEGSELSVLKGAGQLIDSQAIDLIQFEFGGCNIDSRTYFQDFFYLLNPNYRIYRILRSGLVPIAEYKETCEVFLTTNYLAVSREM